MGYVVWMPVQPKGSWIGEGDDFTFMNMLGNGLRAYEEGFYGGWGGRELVKNNRMFFYRRQLILLSKQCFHAEFND